MQYVFFILVTVLGLVIWSIMNERMLIKRLKIQLKEEWATPPQQEYTAEKFESLQSFYHSVQNKDMDIDNITWNDLDMDDIFMLMNNTQSAIGEEYLYALLRKPCFSKEELEERNRLMNYFKEHEKDRILLQSRLYQIGKLSNISIYQYINRLDDTETKSNVPHYLMAFGLIASIGTIFVHPPLGGILTVLFVVNNIYRYYMRKAKIEKYFTVFSYILRLLDGSKVISELKLAELEQYTRTLKEDINSFKSFKKGATLLTPKNVSGDPAGAVLDYFRMLFHFDLIKFNTMLQFVKDNKDTLNRIYLTVGLLDSMMACASFRDMMGYYCEPNLSRSGKPFLEVEDLFHPLIDAPVVNSISEKQSVLITGSNASGKSTFIKTLAINAVLAQTIYTSLSKRYRASYFMIYSSMALRDNLFGNESYYIVEIKSLKRIMDQVNSNVPILCFIDEVLRGTNTLERIAASSRILSSLAKDNTMVFAATHDIELTHILEDYYSNYHFQERILNNQIKFDYKLYKGRAISKNAIKLLGLLGYSKEIIDTAEKAAEEFLITGEWKKI